MSCFVRRRGAALAVLLVLAGAAPAAAHMVKTGGLVIDGVWARATAASARAGAAYLTVINTGAVADRLVGAETDAAGRVDLHTHSVVDGIAMMRPVDGGIPLPPGDTVVLRPGGLHVMLMGLTGPLVQGEKFDLRLRFEHAPAVTVTVGIAAPGASEPAGHH